jgi:hypothetical protein
LAWIACGRRADAERWAERVLEVAPAGFSTQHYFHLTSTATLKLHAGDGSGAFAQIEATWPAIKANHYLSLSLIGDDLRNLRARAAIAAASGTRSSRIKRRALAIAQREARIIERNGLPFAAGWAHLIYAGVHAVRGQRARAARQLQAAQSSLEACELRLSLEATAFALGQVSPADARRAADGERWMLDAGVVDVRAAVRMLVPGFVG